jgi:hypothetical protein
MEISNGLAQAELQTLFGERFLETPERAKPNDHCRRCCALERATHKGCKYVGKWGPRTNDVPIIAPANN